MAELRISRNDHVLTITIDRPERANSISRELSQSLLAALREYQEDRQLWAAIITGSGDRYFSAGADLTDESLLAEPHQWEARYFEGLFGVTKPMIAAVNGWCLGAGFAIALACDLRIAAANARFGTPDQKLNTIDSAGALLLSRMIPRAIAMEILFTGDPIDAAEAYRVGLVNRVVSQEELMSTAASFAERVCANGPLALAACKRLERDSHGMSLREAALRFAHEAETVLASADTREGIAAYREKREPRWSAK